MARDGSLDISEQIEFFFDGSFTGGYREIPLRPGETVTDISVSEGGKPYAPGASAELGSAGAPGTFGVADTGKGVRIVWHYDAANEQRTFRVHYRIRGLTIAHDDVAEVNLKVWGDEWRAGLGRLTATLLLPAPTASGASFRAWGHPVWVPGDVQLLPDRVILRALDVPPRQYIELHAVFPRALLRSTAGAKQVPGAALTSIVAAESADAAAAASGRKRIDAALRHPLKWLLYMALVAFVPVGLILFGAWLRFGREPRLAYDREYEQEPPDDLPPALVPALLRQTDQVGSFEFTATLFDLIRRGRFKSEPTTTSHATWGGAHREEVADIAISNGDHSVEVARFEEPVVDIVTGALGHGEGKVALSALRGAIAADRTANSQRFAAFRERCGTEISSRRWYVNRGRIVVLVPGLAFAAAGAILFFTGTQDYNSLAPRWSDLVALVVGACLVVNAVILLAVGFFRAPLWRRRSAVAALEAERWDAFRRYLTDFPRLDIAPPATLELWERMLVYGIAFGIAEKVLQGAQLHMSKELHDASSVYWIAPYGHLGSGPSALAIGDLSAGFGSALAPPSSGSGGFGGGFSGGGGFGGGGGTGGAW